MGTFLTLLTTKFSEKIVEGGGRSYSFLVRLLNLSNNISLYNPTHINLFKYLSTVLKSMYYFRICFYNMKTQNDNNYKTISREFTEQILFEDLKSFASAVSFPK